MVLLAFVVVDSLLFNIESMFQGTQGASVGSYSRFAVDSACLAS